MIQHIFLDLDDTIFDFKKAERIAGSLTVEYSKKLSQVA